MPLYLFTNCRMRNNRAQFFKIVQAAIVCHIQLHYLFSIFITTTRDSYVLFKCYITRFFVSDALPIQFFWVRLYWWISSLTVWLWAEIIFFSERSLNWCITALLPSFFIQLLNFCLEMLLTIYIGKFKFLKIHKTLKVITLHMVNAWYSILIQL